MEKSKKKKQSSKKGLKSPENIRRKSGVQSTKELSTEQTLEEEMKKIQR